MNMNASDIIRLVSSILTLVAATLDNTGNNRGDGQ